MVNWADENCLTAPIQHKSGQSRIDVAGIVSPKAERLWYDGGADSDFVSSRRYCRQNTVMQRRP
jgi:hypothetical protein